MGNNAAKIRQRMRYKSLGLCRECGTPVTDGKLRCILCSQGHVMDESKRKCQRLMEGRCSLCRGPLISGSTCPKCKQLNRRRKDTYREQIITAYGGKCVRCGIDDHDVLTIDHVHEDGAAQRRIIGNSFARLRKIIIEAGFPSDYQILCFNCNFKKHLEYKRSKYESIT